MTPLSLQPTTAPASRWRAYSGDELLELEPEPLEYLPLLGQEGYFVKGWTHLLAGFPRAGKTELLMRCIRDWIEDEPWRADEDARDKTLPWVTYFSEESVSIWSQRLRKLAHPKRGGWWNLDIVPATGMPVEELLDCARVSVADVLVLDTMRGLLAIEDENDSAQIAAAVKPWIELSQRTGATLIVLHHQRKGGGEHGEGVAGGHGLVGAFDVIIELKRDRSGVDNRRIISTLARVVPAQEGMYELAEDGEMRFLGDKAVMEREGVTSRIWSALDEAGEWLTIAELRERLTDPKPGATSVRAGLIDLASQGRVLRDPALSRGKVAGVTVKWRAVLPLSARQDG